MKILLFLSFVFLLTNCATTTEQQGPHTDVGLWTGKVQMTNKTTQHRQWANVVWASNSTDDQMRIDITAIMDIPLATFMQNKEGSHLWLFNEKKYFHSEDGAKLFQHLTKLSVNPRIFYSMLGHPQSPGVEWMCQDEEAVFRCNSQINKTQLFVKHEEKNQRTIKIERGSKALRLRLSRAKVQLQDKLFDTLSTSQFKTIQL